MKKLILGSILIILALGSLLFSGACCGKPNGIVDEGEQCDSSNLNGETCDSQGFDGGELYCNDECIFDFSYCTKCGNGIQEANEKCDGTDFGGVTCEDLGFDGGSLGCSSDCKNYNTVNCIGCGNNKAEYGEQCDGIDLRGETCKTLGYASGILACTDLCKNYDISDCSRCGDGIVQEGLGEECDPGPPENLNGKNCFTEKGITRLDAKLHCNIYCNFIYYDCYKYS